MYTVKIRILVFHGLELVLVFLGMFFLSLSGISLQLSDSLPLKFKTFFKGSLEDLFLSSPPVLQFGLQTELVVMVVPSCSGGCLPLGMNTGPHCYLLLLLF